MKNIMIKVLVLALGVLSYAGVSQYFQIQRLEDKQTQLENTITELEELQEELERSIQENTIIEDSCTKLYEITIQVIVEKDDLDETVIHCTNRATLGDALDEISDELELIYNPQFDKEYIYGRLVHSFYGVSKEFEQYYEITINGIRADFGVDLITLEDGNSYEFTLVRWA